MEGQVLILKGNLCTLYNAQSYDSLHDTSLVKIGCTCKLEGNKNGQKLFCSTTETLSLFLSRMSGVFWGKSIIRHERYRETLCIDTNNSMLTKQFLISCFAFQLFIIMSVSKCLNECNLSSVRLKFQDNIIHGINVGRTITFCKHFVLSLCLPVVISVNDVGLCFQNTYRLVVEGALLSMFTA